MHSKIHWRKRFCGLLTVLFLSPTCWADKPAWHHVEIRNFYAEKTEINMKGVQLYAPGTGPQEFSSAGNPEGSARWTTSGSMYLTYPLEVTWKSQVSGKECKKEFHTVPGVAESMKKITLGGTLVVRITPDFDAEVLFVKDYLGEGLVTHQSIIEYQFEQLHKMLQAGGNEQQYTESLPDMPIVKPTLWERIKNQFSQTQWIDRCPLVSVYNHTGEDLRISVNGVQVYPVGIGPQELSKKIKPEDRTGYSYGETISLNYPVTVSWESQDGTKKGEKKFDAVPRLSGTEMSEESLLAIRISPEFDAQIIFIPHTEFKERGSFYRVLSGDIKKYFETPIEQGGTKPGK